MRLLPFALFAPTAALAHVGDHSQGFWATLTHLLTQPDHIAMALGALALGYVLIRARKG